MAERPIRTNSTDHDGKQLKTETSSSLDHGDPDGHCVAAMQYDMKSFPLGESRCAGCETQVGTFLFNQGQ